MKAIKRLLVIVVISSLFLHTLIQEGNGVHSEKASNGIVFSEIKVAVTTTLLADFVGYITNSEIEPIIGPGVCPAHYDSEPSDVALIENADIIFSHGFEGQWLNDLLSGAEKLDAKFNVGPLVDSLPWGVPAHAKLYLNIITAKLNETYPDKVTLFNTQLSSYEAEIDTKAIYLQTLAQTYGLVGKKAIVMSHQISFCQFLGLDVVGNWSKSDELMSLLDVANLIALADEKNAEIIISNLQSGTSIGEEVSIDLRIPHAVVTNFPQSCNGTETYLKTLEYNLKEINKAINSTMGMSSPFLSIIFGALTMLMVNIIIRKKIKKT